ncbi:hypothetical protein [Oleiharenicola lentus]|uniref:hypothetical protein n=1 Tax=Oleiharenicola lentus TaxID=2508720 RepID=UPI003F6740BD
MKSSISKIDLHVGIWRSSDEFGSDLEYRITKKKTGYSVVACDSNDGELADIFEEKWDAKTGIFSFAAHWNSTGRFARYRFFLTSKDKMTLTYTYTDSETLIRSHGKKD